MAAQDEQGVVFPSVVGSRASTPTAREILAAAVCGCDSARADRIGAAAAWRTEYVEHYVAATALGAGGAADALRVASDGLAAMRRSLCYRIAERETPLDEIAWDDAISAKAVTVHGERGPGRELAVPYRGARLAGDALRDQLHRWRERGIVESGFVNAIERVIAEPERLTLPGRQIALIGAAAEMGPLRPLCEWGADLLTIDVPVAAVQTRIAELARGGAGSVTVPQREDLPGLDVTTTVSEAAAWLLGVAAADKQLVLGMYGYADGARHVTLTAAVDAVATRLQQHRAGTALAFLGTPTDSYLVPETVVAQSHQRWDERGRVRGPVADALRLASRDALCRRGYPQLYPGADGSRWGVADILLPMQGPNYALAKRLQRWRALVSAAAGQPVSMNVAPAAWTRSVTKNKVFSVAYAGAERFGVEIFPADTARYLMAAKLVADLTDAPKETAAHPESLLYSDAAHGGFWRQPFEVRSVLPLAALFGAAAHPGRLLGR